MTFELCFTMVTREKAKHLAFRPLSRPQMSYNISYAN